MADKETAVPEVPESENMEVVPENEKMVVEDTVSGTGSVEPADDKSLKSKTTSSFDKSDTASPLSPDTSGFVSTTDTPSGSSERAPVASPEESLPPSAVISPSEVPISPPVTPVETEVSQEVALPDKLASTSVEPSEAPADAPVSSPPKKPQKTSAFEAIKKMISPQKKEIKEKEEGTPSPGEKVKGGFLKRFGSRSSKSMSPPEQKAEPAGAVEATIPELPESAEDPSMKVDMEVSPADFSPSKKHQQKEGLGSKLKKSLSSVAGFFSGNKGSSTSAVQEARGLMTDPETSELGGEVKTKKKPEEDEFKPSAEFMAKGRSLSLVSQPDTNFTQSTDVPSSVSSDLFSQEEETLSKSSSTGNDELVSEGQATASTSIEASSVAAVPVQVEAVPAQVEAPDSLQLDKGAFGTEAVRVALEQVETVQQEQQMETEDSRKNQEIAQQEQQMETEDSGENQEIAQPEEKEKDKVAES